MEAQQGKLYESNTNPCHNDIDTNKNIKSSTEEKKTMKGNKGKKTMAPTTNEINEKEKKKYISNQ